MNNEATTPPPGVSTAEYARHLDRLGKTTARRGDGVEFSDLLAQLATLPPETEAEREERERKLAESNRAERISRFRKTCPPEFMARVERAQLPNPDAFDLVTNWDGSFPGPLCHGTTGTAKTRAAWGALYRLNIDRQKTVAWFPVKRLITEFIRYETKDLADEFWRYYSGYNMLFVDDLDKFNSQFDSECAAIFSFYDWIYRERRPCITTTNKSREWWSELMGDAFARRLFDEAHNAIQF